MAKLKKKFAKKDDIPEPLREFYHEVDGSWVPVGIEGDDEDRRKLTEFRESNRTMRGELDTLRTELGDMRKRYDGVDPERYKKVQEQIDKMEADEEKALMAEGKIDEVVKRRTAAAITAKDDELKALNEAHTKSKARNALLTKKLGTQTIEREVQEEIGRQKLRIRTGALPDVLARTNQTWKIDEEGNPAPVGNDGKALYGEEGAVIKMPEFVTAHLLKGAGHLFETGKGSGSDGSGDADPTREPGTVQADDLEGKARNLKDIADGKVKVVQ